MTPEQNNFWKPYIELIGEENFTIIKGKNATGDFVHSKFYCGMDSSKLGLTGKGNLDVAILRYYLYQEILSNGKLTADDIETIFLSYVDKAYFDTELVYLLTQHGAELSLDEYWELVIDCWCRQEFTTKGGRGDNWKIIFNHREKPIYLTKDLPDTFIAYRAGKETGFSWTLDKDIADFFHQRFEEEFGDIPMLKRTFSRSDVVFYTNIRNEEEVVILS
jgi:hypothetical protein